jgi:hypothetical protein
MVLGLCASLVQPRRNAVQSADVGVSLRPLARYTDIAGKSVTPGSIPSCDSKVVSWPQWWVW